MAAYDVFGLLKSQIGAPCHPRGKIVRLGERERQSVSERPL